MCSIIRGKFRINAVKTIKNSFISSRFSSAVVTDIASSDQKPIRTEWFDIGGFSRFSSRRDLETVLGDLQPLKIDPILDNNLFPIGHWAVLLPVGNPSDIKNTLIQNNPKATCFQLSKDSFPAMKLASKSGITNCSVRFRNVPSEIGIEELRYFLQEYNLEDGPCAIVPFNTENRQAFHHFMINFATAEEAERVVLEKCFTMLEGSPVQMFWYNC